MANGFNIAFELWDTWVERDHAYMLYTIGDKLFFMDKEIKNDIYS